jgi:hypothetical protein
MRVMQTVLAGLLVAGMVLGGASCSSGSDDNGPGGEVQAEASAEVGVEAADDATLDKDVAGTDAVTGTDTATGTDTVTGTDTATGTETGTGVEVEYLEGLPCPVVGAAFDLDQPGINALFALTSFSMMGQGQEMGIGMFLKAGREDFEVLKPGEQPLDTCIVTQGGSGIVPGCATDTDCPPDQKCLAPKDEPQDLQCRTQRDPLNVGPMTVTGLKSGPQTFMYNEGQSGAYTCTSDGSLPAGEIIFDSTYVAEGDGDHTQGLGHFRAELYVPAQLQLLEPVAEAGQFGGASQIPVDTTQDLTLKWTTGTDGGILDISLAGASMTGAGGGINCHVINDGQFTIPADMLAKAQLGDTAFFNMLTLTRETPGLFCGEGISVGLSKFATVVLLNVQKTK